MALVMSFHDPFNVFVYCSNQCDVVPFKNSRKKLSHSINVLSPVPLWIEKQHLRNHGHHSINDTSIPHDMQVISFNIVWSCIVLVKPNE
jgi:hypothetical protein